MPLDRGCGAKFVSGLDKSDWKLSLTFVRIYCSLRADSADVHNARCTDDVRPDNTGLATKYAFPSLLTLVLPSLGIGRGGS